MQTQNKILPGLLCDSVEFFMDGKDMKFLSSGKVKSFYDLPFLVFQLLREKINGDAPILKELMRMHPDSEMKRIEQYVICNFSGLDFTADINNGVLQEGEYWPCPLRGICPGEGIICKPLVYEGQVVNAVEIKMIKLLVTDLTNEVMAEEMCLPLGTFHKVKKNLYQKLNVSTKQEIAMIAVKLSIV